MKYYKVVRKTENGYTSIFRTNPLKYEIGKPAVSKFPIFVYTENCVLSEYNEQNTLLRVDVKNLRIVKNSSFYRNISNKMSDLQLESFWQNVLSQKIDSDMYDDFYFVCDEIIPIEEIGPEYILDKKMVY